MSTPPIHLASDEPLMRASISYFASRVLRGPPQAPYNGRFLVARHHEEWDALAHSHDRLCVLAARDMGKCAAPGSLMLASDGRRVPVENWTDGLVMALDTVTMQFGATWAPASRTNGTRQVLRVTTATGRRDTVTLNHPFLTPAGWKEAQHLQPGDQLGVPRVFSPNTAAALPNARALGMVTATCTQENGFQLPEQFRSQCPAWEQLARDNCGNAQRVPDRVFISGYSGILEFLSGVIFAAGNENAQREIEMGPFSEEMARALQHLFSRISVIASVRPVNGKWLVSLPEKENAIFRGERAFNPRAWPLPTEKEIAEIAAAVGTRMLSPIYWDRVISVEPQGEQPTFSVHVPGFSNYLANDLIQHNTFFWDFALPLHRAAFNPGGRGYIFSGRQGQSVRILGDIKEEIESNPQLQHLMPQDKDLWNNMSIKLANGHRIDAVGYGVKVRGAHPNWIVVDDALNDEDGFSEVTRKKNIDYFFSAISGMVVPGGQIVVVGCVNPSTYVATDTGLVRIGTLHPDPAAGPQTLHPLNRRVAGRDGFRVASHFWDNGVCATKKITLQRGFTLEGSHRHPVLVMGPEGAPEWRRMPELQVGDYVAVKAGVNAWGPGIDLRPFKDRHALGLPDAVTPDMAYLIGLWTAEGSTPEGFLGLIQFLSGDRKIIPERIMSGPWEIARAFLQGLYAGGGNGAASGALRTPSAELADQVQQLLLNAGIIASRSCGPSPETWEVTVTSGEAELFEHLVGFEQHGAHGPATTLLRQNLQERFVWLPIRKIENGESATVDFVVPEGNSFLSNGIVSHNTPFSDRDLYGELQRNPEYVSRRYPALSENGESLWPDRYSQAALERKRREIGSVRFTREYLVQPISDDMSIFPSHLFRGQPTEQMALTLGMPGSYWDQVGVRRFIGVDLAISTSAGADWTVIFVLGADDFGNRWVVDIIRERGLPFQQQLSLINAAGRKYDPELIFIEANQMQRVFGDELLRTTDLPIKKFVTTGTGKGAKYPGGNTVASNKNSLEGGVPSLRVLLENGKFRIPRGDARSVEITDRWIEEMRAFTWTGGKLQGVAEHDDTVLSCWIADQAVRRGGFSFSSGNEKAKSLDEILKDQMAEPAEEEPATPAGPPSGRRDNPVTGAQDLYAMLSVGSGAPGEEEAEESGSGHQASLVGPEMLAPPGINWLRLTRR